MKVKFTSNSKRRLGQIVDYYDRQASPGKGDLGNWQWAMGKFFT